AVLLGLGKPTVGAPAAAPTEVAWPQPHKYNTDVATAKPLLAESGSPNGFETTLSSDLGFAGVNEPLCVLTQESLAQIGIKCTINKIPGATWRTERVDRWCRDRGGGGRQGGLQQGRQRLRRSRLRRHAAHPALSALRQRRDA